MDDLTRQLTTFDVGGRGVSTAALALICTGYRFLQAENNDSAFATCGLQIRIGFSWADNSDARSDT